MRISKKAIVFTVFISLFLYGPLPGAAAEDMEIKFKHLSTVDGLSNFTVLAIAQDHRGFMWFGTMDGLNRYDGKNIKIYQEDPEVPYSLGSSYIWSLLTASDSGLWVGSNRGLYFYDYHHDNFHSIPICDDKGQEVINLSIRSLLQSEKILWIGTDRGLYRYDLADRSFIPFEGKIIDDNRPVGKVIALQQSEDGKI